MHIFGRSPRAAHPFLPTLERWLARTPPDRYSAMACNLVHDHRVTAERAARLEQYFADAMERDDEQPLEAAIKRYFEHQVKFRKIPAFLDPTNRPNILPAVAQHFTTALPKRTQARRSGPPHADLWLARVLILNGLTAPFLSARAAGHEVFKDFPRLPRRTRLPQRTENYQRQILAWLDSHLLGKPLPEQRAFVTMVLEALEQGRKNMPYQPTWATYWQPFERHVPDPDRWASVVGVPNWWRSARWLLVLRYRIRETGSALVRPTVLDSGFNPYHFPSPPQAQLEKGGHPVDLRLSPRPDHLLPEFIHQQIKHGIDHWQHAGFLLARTDQPPDGLLAERRGNHYHLLVREYGKRVRDWMDRCI